MSDLIHYFCCIHEQPQSCSTETEDTWKETTALKNSSFLFGDSKYSRNDIAHNIFFLRNFAAMNLDNVYFYYAKHTGATLVEPAYLNQFVELLGQDRSFEYVSQILIQIGFTRLWFGR